MNDEDDYNVVDYADDAVFRRSALDLAAQSTHVPGQDLITLNLIGGVFSPASDLGGSQFDAAGTLGGSVGVWLHRYVGVRASIVWAQTDVSGPESADLMGVDPNVWAYSGDLVLRLPIVAGSGWLVPYIVGGLGAKTYDFKGVDSETEFVGSFGGGVEYRFPSSRWGINLEARDFVSSFESFGIDETQHDVVWTGGITLSF